MKIRNLPSAAVLAEITARIAHAGQTDKAGEPYIGHVAQVAAGVASEDTVTRTAAWLHDVVEDTAETLEHLALVGEETLDGCQLTAWHEALRLVEALTHRPDEHHSHYHARIRKAGPRAVTVKLSDVASNTDPERLAALDPGIARRLREKYAKTTEEIAR